MSSIFDLSTFGWLLWVMGANQAQFHTGWFIESVASAALVVFAVRTRLPLFASRPSRMMLLATGLVCVAAVALPYMPLAALLEFTPLPPGYLFGLAVIVALYVRAAEVTKRWFHRHHAPGRQRCSVRRAACSAA